MKKLTRSQLSKSSTPRSCKRSRASKGSGTSSWPKRLQVETLGKSNQEMREKLADLEKRIDSQNQELAKLKLQKKKIDEQSSEFKKDLMAKTEKLKHN